MNILELSDLQKDVLKEIGNIGAGNAASSFAEMLQHRIDMEVPKIEIAAIADVPEMIGGAEEPMVGVYFRVEGELAASLLFVLDLNSAGELLSIFLGGERRISSSMSELEVSTLSEIGNILSSSYLGALSTLTNLRFNLSVPALALDMAGAILNIALIPMGEVGNHTVFIENIFKDGSYKVQGHFFLLPDPDTFSAIFNTLGV